MDIINIPEPQVRPVGRAEGTLQQQVYSELRRSLMVGAFIPGQSVTLRSLARRLGTSPMPIREAINRLIAERALEMLPNRSVVVPRMTRQKFTELSMLREKFEGMAAEAAGRRVTPELVKKLTKLNDEILSSIAKRDVPRILEGNQQFHFALYEASGYVLLVPMIESLWLQAGPFMYVSLSAADTLWNATLHKVAIEALAAGDAVATRKAIEKDVRTTARSLLQSIEFES
jgi:DNA-binding GntR family transcriptional regulator